MHPRCRHIGACWDLLECWFHLFSTSQNTNQNSISNFMESITNVGLILTKLRWFHLLGTSQNSISNFWKKKKFKFLGFHAVVLVKTLHTMAHTRPSCVPSSTTPHPTGLPKHPHHTWTSLRWDRRRLWGSRQDATKRPRRPTSEQRLGSSPESALGIVLPAVLC